MGNDKDSYFSTELCGGTHVKNTADIGRFKIVSQSAIASGVRRVEALRASQLEEYEKLQKDTKTNTDKKLNNQIKLIKEELSKINIKPNYNANINLNENLKNLSKQFDQIKIKNILNDKKKNIIKDKKVGSFQLRFQVVTDLPSKELRNIVDQGKKEIKEGILIVFSTFENKVGVSVGVTQNLTTKFDAVQLVKKAAEILGGKGGGGRKDFAQAGGVNKAKIEEAFSTISKEIN